MSCEEAAISLLEEDVKNESTLTVESLTISSYSLESVVSITFVGSIILTVEVDVQVVLLSIEGLILFDEVEVLLEVISSDAATSLSLVDVSIVGRLVVVVFFVVEGTGLIENGITLSSRVGLVPVLTNRASGQLISSEISSPSQSSTASQTNARRMQVPLLHLN